MGNWVLVGGRKMHDVILKLFLLITRKAKGNLFSKTKKTKTTKISSSIGTALVCYEM
jgi:hypothetical protein